MKRLLALASLLVLAACGSSGPPPPDWKTDAADLIERYKKHALQGENLLAERYFKQAIAATGGAGRVSETARLWLVRCATRRAMLIDDPCNDYQALASAAPQPDDAAYFRFITLDWDAIENAHLPAQYRDLIKAQPDQRPAGLARIGDPLSKLLAASLLVQRGEAAPETLLLATETASHHGWRQPLLTYLKLLEQQAQQAGDSVQVQRHRLRIDLIKDSLASGRR